MLSNDILTAITNKDILNQRFATDLSEQTNDILSEMARWLRSKLSDTHNLFGEELTPAKVRRFNNLLSTIEAKLDEVYSTINDLYMEQFRELAIDDVDFVSQVINEELKENFLMTKPSDARLWSAVMDNPLHFPDDVRTPYVNFVQMVESLGVNAKRVADTISGGYYAGLTNQELVRQLIGTKKNNYQDGLVDISRKDANRIIRTSLTHVTAQARKRLYDDNKDVAFGYRIVATIDTRTSNICKSLDGRVIKFTAPKSEQIMPPFHHNCLLPDTNVITCNGVSNVFKRAYKGIAVDIATKSGLTLSVTPNHPILTCSGWVAAKDIDRSYKLATITDSHVVIDNQKDSIVANISDLFGALEVSSDPRFIADRPTTAEHFHGDVSDANVRVINVDSLSWSAVKSIFNKEIKNDSLLCRSDFSLSGFCSFDLFRFSGDSSACGDVSRSSERPLGFCASSIHSSLLLFGSISKSTNLSLKESPDCTFTTSEANTFSYTSNANARFVSADDGFLFRISELNYSPIGNSDTVFSQNSFNWLVTNSIELPDLLASNSAYGVEFDDVSNVSFREVDTHVYNLENKNNWYIANGIITHNCRTATVPEIYGRELKDSGATRAVNFKARKGVEKGTVGQVDAQQTYLDILRKQPLSQIELALGKARAEIFKNAGLTTDEFRQALADNMGRPLTLAEMAKKSRKILDYMKSRKDLEVYIDD